MEKKCYLFEEWRDIPGYKGLYQISNFGRVRSLDNIVVGRNGCKRHLKGKIMKPSKETCGYLGITLVKEGYAKRYRVHRLVALVFLPNPHNYPNVNHKDENKTNNFVFINSDGSVNSEKSNLEWCTQGYNINYGTRNQKVSKSMTNGKLAKTVLQYDKKGKLIKKYPSTREVERQTGFKGSGICACCTGKYKQAYGFVWKYA